MRRALVGAVVGVGFSALGGCFLEDIDLTGRPCPCADGYACVNDVCVLGGMTGASSASGTGGATTSSSAASMTTTSSDTTTSSSTGVMPLPLSKPLVYESKVGDGKIALRTDDAFRIEATPTTRWQWTKYFDLANGDPDNLASTQPGAQYQDTNVLFEPAYLTTNEMDWASSQSASVVDVTVTDQTPLRVLVETTLSYPFTGAELYAASMTYPSGRMTTYVELYNTSASTLSFAQVEYNYVSVNPNLPGGPAEWTTASTQGLGIGFLHAAGPAPKSTVLFINLFGDTNIHHDSDFTNWYWGDFGAVTLGPPDSIYADGELQLGPSGQPATNLQIRTDDALNPELEIQSGGTAVDEGYNTYQGAYQIVADDAATKVVFGASNAYERHAPAFEIYGFKPTKWHVLFQGLEVCSSLEHVGHGCVAWEEPDHIAFALMTDIPASAPVEDRLLTLEGIP
jgi:hypothetical protein